MRFLVFFLLSINLIAAPVGNPTLPFLLEEGFAIPDTAWSNLQSGIIGDYLFQKKMRSHQEQINFSGFSEAANVVWNIRERFNIGFVLGSAQYKLKHKMRSGILFTGDAKLIIFNVKDTTFALDGQVGGWNGSLSHLRYWQVGMALTQKLGYISPYAGCAIHRMRGKISTTPETLWFHEIHHLGPFGGISFSNGDLFLFNVEYRALFESGLTLSAQIRF